MLKQGIKPQFVAYSEMCIDFSNVIVQMVEFNNLNKGFIISLFNKQRLKPTFEKT